MEFVYVHFVILIKMEDFVSNYIIEDCYDSMKMVYNNNNHVCM